MSTAAAIANLGAELVVFIAAASILLVTARRPELLGAPVSGRVLLSAASLLMVATALAQGASVDMDPSEPWAVVARLAAVVLLGGGAATLGHAPARRAVVVGAALMVAAEGLYVVDPTTVGDVVRGLGGLSVAAAAATGARRSISVRIATAATALLVVVVLLLSAVLSVVVTGNIADEALQRAEERARIESELAAQETDTAVKQAAFVANSLASSQVGREAIQSGDYTVLQEALEAIRTDYSPADFYAFVDAQGAARVGTDPDRSFLVEMAGTDAVVDARRGNPAAAIDVVGGHLVALAAAPARIPDAAGVPVTQGVGVAGNRLDRQYLEFRRQRQADVSFTLVTEGRVVSSTLEGRPRRLRAVVGEELAPEVRRRVLGDGNSLSAQTTVDGAGRFVAVSPVVGGDGRPVAALVVRQDTGIVDDTRESLFRTLFLVALAAAAVAFAVAAYAAARLAAPVQQLTEAARRVSRGDLTARAGVQADDEIGVLGASFDTMTDSIERMTREIREAAAQTEAILTGMAEGIVATDAAGGVVALNPAAERLLGVKESKAVGQPVERVIKGTERNGAPLSRRLSGGLARPFATNGLVDRPGGRVAVAMSGSPIQDEGGEVIGRVYVMRDVQREAEVEAMKTEFLSNISHELRTPLTPIKGYAEMMLSRTVPPERTKAFLGNILESAERLERYVDMLVNFSAMEAGRFTLQAEEVDVAALATRVGERWRSSSPGHRVDVSTSSRLPRVVADPRLLERALNELMDNAVKYSPDGGTVRLRGRARGTGAARHVELSVADEGIGIEPDQLEQIFSDFAQLDGSSTRRYGGLGLGLSFVDRVVRAHHGTLEAHSEPGKGSEFVIALPLAGQRSTKGSAKRSDGARKAPAPKPAKTAAGKAGRRR